MRRRNALVIAAAVLTLSGCATIRRHEAASTEQLLAAAGFQMRPADNADREHDLSVMPPLKLVARSQGDQVSYTFADPYKCRCLYVGGPKEYSAYQNILLERQMEAERIREEQEALDWGVWGPWWR